MDTTATINILQYNVQHWNTNRENLINTYFELNPDIILLVNHGKTNTKKLQIKGYNTYIKKNSTGEMHDGSAILVKSNTRHTVKDDYITDILETTLQTTVGTTSIATTYLPPRRPYLPFPDFHKLLYNNNPTYIVGDLNAKHTHLGDQRSNTVGKGTATFIQEGKGMHLGPNVPTFFTQITSTTPDIILSNNKAAYNIITKPGPLTTADHVPILITLTTEAV